MRILFLHSRYPAQFLHLIRNLAASEQHEIVYLAQNRRMDLEIPNVRVVKVPTKEPAEGISHSEKSLLTNFYNGELFAHAMLELAKEGFYPDLVYDHPGWGCGSYVQDIFPAAARVCYCEWFYTKNADYRFFSKGKPRPPASFAANRQRNLCQLDALKDCDVAITPTFW